VIEISAAEFRVGFAGISNPVEVTKYGKTLGTWFPGRHACDGAPVEGETDKDDEIKRLTEEIVTLKRRLVSQPLDPSFGEPRPAPKPRGRPRKVKTEE
jgi:hypothetical protein